MTLSMSHGTKNINSRNETEDRHQKDVVNDVAFIFKDKRKQTSRKCKSFER